MAYETRRNQSYYYRKHWQDGTCVSEYLRIGTIAKLAAAFDDEKRTARALQRSQERAERQQDREIEQMLRAAEEEIRALTRAVLLVNGFRTHKRQWRRKRAET